MIEAATIDFKKLIKQRNADNRFMLLVGVTITEMSTGYAAGEIILSECHRNLIGSVHGGCIFTLADSVSGAAAVSHGNKATTLSSDFHYLNPALDCKKLIAKATEIKYGKTINVFEVKVTDEKDRLLAQGTFSYFILGGI